MAPGGRQRGMGLSPVCRALLERRTGNYSSETGEEEKFANGPRGEGESVPRAGFLGAQSKTDCTEHCGGPCLE